MRNTLVFLLSIPLGWSGCVPPLRVHDDGPLPVLYRSGAAYHQAGAVVAYSADARARPAFQTPVTTSACSAEQADVSIRVFLAQRGLQGVGHLEDWRGFIMGIQCYLAQSIPQIRFPLVMRARVTAETEFTRECRLGNGCPLDLQREVSALLTRIDEIASQLAQIQRVERRRVEQENGTRLSWPLERGLLTSAFGPRQDPFDRRLKSFHWGIDLAAPPNEPILAAFPGTVVSCGWSGLLGKAVRIRHARGVETVYGHLEDILVQPGQRLQRGEVIGLLGETGHTTGHHLHFALRIGGQNTDPMPYMDMDTMIFTDVPLASTKRSRDSILHAAVKH